MELLKYIIAVLFLVFVSRCSFPVKKQSQIFLDSFNKYSQTASTSFDQAKISKSNLLKYDSLMLKAYNNSIYADSFFLLKGDCLYAEARKEYQNTNLIDKKLIEIHNSLLFAEEKQKDDLRQAKFYRNRIKSSKLAPLQH